MDLAFFDALERTPFSDELYAIIGRALTVATHYEANLRVLVTVLDVKPRRHHLVKAGKLEEEVLKLSKLTLNSNVRRLVSRVKRPSGKRELKPEEAEMRTWLAGFLSQKLHHAREARNTVAHEAALGIECHAEDEERRRDLIEMIDEQIRYIAEADFHIAGLIEHLNGTNIATSLEEYIETIAKWVCDVEY